MDSTQIHVSNTPTGSVVSSGKSVADSLEVNTPMSPADPVTSPAKNSGVEVKQTESPIPNKPMDTDDSPTEEPPAMFSSSSASKEDGGKKKKNTKRCCRTRHSKMSKDILLQKAYMWTLQTTRPMMRRTIEVP